MIWQTCIFVRWSFNSVTNYTSTNWSISSHHDQDRSNRGHNSTKSHGLLLPVITYCHSHITSSLPHTIAIITSATNELKLSYPSDLWRPQILTNGAGHWFNCLGLSADRICSVTADHYLGVFMQASHTSWVKLETSKLMLILILALPIKDIILSLQKQAYQISESGRLPAELPSHYGVGGWEWGCTHKYQCTDVSCLVIPYTCAHVLYIILWAPLLIQSVVSINVCCTMSLNTAWPIPFVL